MFHDFVSGFLNVIITMELAAVLEVPLFKYFKNFSSASEEIENSKNGRALVMLRAHTFRKMLFHAIRCTELS